MLILVNYFFYSEFFLISRVWFKFNYLGISELGNIVKNKFMFFLVSW